MSYRLRVIGNDGHLHLRVEGENTPQNVAAYIAEARQLCLDHGASSLLLEECLHGPSLSTIDVYRLASESAQEGLVVDRLAFVDTAPGHDASMMEFAETVAVNRGARVRMFPSVEEARQWLESESARGDRIATGTSPD